MKRNRILSMILLLLMLPMTVFGAIDRKELDSANAKFQKMKAESGNLKEFSKHLNLIIDNVDVTKVLKHKPMAIDGSTSVALRDLTERIGAKVTWYDHSRMIGIEHGKSHILVPVDKKAMWVNGKIVDMNIAAKIHGETSTTYIPLRDIAQALGYKVEFDNETFTAKLFSQKKTK